LFSIYSYFLENFDIILKFLILFGIYFNKAFFCDIDKVFDVIISIKH
jgi:hypothetical protein